MAVIYILKLQITEVGRCFEECQFETASNQREIFWCTVHAPDGELWLLKPYIKIKIVFKVPLDFCLILFHWKRYYKLPLMLYY